MQQEDPALKFLNNEKSCEKKNQERKGRRKEGHGHGHGHA